MDTISNFLVFEGGDGSGTTTQLTMLSQRLNAEGKAFYSTCEPTGGQIGKLIRSALKAEAPVKPKTLAMLFSADRNEHLYAPEGILAKAADNQLVICDRYALSSLVYQGIECGDELPLYLNRAFPAPEITIYLDVDPNIAIERMKGRESVEIYEYKEFQEKVREKYKSAIKLYRDNGARVEIIDASKSAQEVANEVWSIVSQMPILKIQ